MKMNPQVVVSLIVVVTSYLFFSGFLQPKKLEIKQTVLLGASVDSTNSEDLTVLASMPFMTYSNHAVIDETQVNDEAFYVPVPKVVEATLEQQLSELAEAEEFAPEPLPVIKNDYEGIARSKIRLQALLNNGAIINDHFYTYQKRVKVSHIFEDGDNLEVMLIKQEGRGAIFDVNGVNILINLKKG